MPTIDDRRRPLRIGFLVALIASSVLHAAAFVAGGFLPYTSAQHARPDGTGSEFVIELRLGPRRNSVIEMETPTNVEATHDPVPAESDPLFSDVTIARAPDPQPLPRVTSDDETALDPPNDDAPLAPVPGRDDALPLVADTGLAALPTETPSSTNRDLMPVQPSAERSRSTVPPGQEPRPADDVARAVSKDLSPRDSSKHASPSSTPRMGESRGAAVIANPRPTYPSASRRLGEEGEVLCLLHVRADGTVERVEVLRSSGFPRLDRAATDGLKRWRFAPALENGLSVATTVRHKVTFVVE